MNTKLKLNGSYRILRFFPFMYVSMIFWLHHLGLLLFGFVGSRANRIVFVLISSKTILKTINYAKSTEFVVKHNRKAHNTDLFVCGHARSLAYSQVIKFPFRNNATRKHPKNLGEIYVLMKWKKRKKTFSFGHYVFGCSVSVSCCCWCANKFFGEKKTHTEREKWTEDIKKVYLSSSATFLQNTCASCKKIYEQSGKKWNRNDTQSQKKKPLPTATTTTTTATTTIPWNQQVRHCRFARISEYGEWFGGK